MFGYSWIKDPLWYIVKSNFSSISFSHLSGYLATSKCIFFPSHSSTCHLHSAPLSGAASSLQRSLSSGIVTGPGAVFASMCKSRKRGWTWSHPLRGNSSQIKTQESTEQKGRGRCLASQGQEGGWQVAGWESRNRFHFTCKICHHWERENEIPQSSARKTFRAPGTSIPRHKPAWLCNSTMLVLCQLKAGY